MPSKPTEIIEENGRQVAIYANGMKRDVASGKLLHPPSHALITVENANAFHLARQQQKRAVIQAAANAAVQDGRLTTAHGDLAFVAAIAETAFIKATTPDDPKAIDAARFLLQETRLAEAQSVSADQSKPADALAALVTRLLEGSG